MQLAAKLMERPSISPKDAGCHDILAEFFESAGFIVERIDVGQVSNLWATHGNQDPIVCVTGHCDVVPPGPLDEWEIAPFEPTVKDGALFGRGAADMKGSLAAMAVGAVEFVTKNQDHSGTVAFLSTSDEEGEGVDGTRAALAELASRGVDIAAALVGEPTSRKEFGDTIKVGRRGSLTGYLTVKGTQGHVAYPHLADNPIHRIAPFLADLVKIEWDEASEHFPATSLQIANINAGTGAVNVIPADVQVNFNLRLSPLTEARTVMDEIASLAKRHSLDYVIEWSESAKAFLTSNQDLIQQTSAAVVEISGREPKLDTGGGTSDARFFAAGGIPVVEFGPVGATMHAANEEVSVADLDGMHQFTVSWLRRMLNSTGG